MENIIKVEDMKKSYRDIEAVKGISFSVRKGAFFALLGENGAGKSTTINIISTLLKKTSGDVTVNGHVLDKEDGAIREDIGMVFQNSMLDDHLTVRENIISRGGLYRLPKRETNKRLEMLSETSGLADFIDRRYGKLSGGQRRRADITRAIINEPKVLILDEPTTGLDPKMRQSVWEMIRKLKKETNLTIFLTTHYMEEAAEADHIVIIDAGRIKAQGTPEMLRRQYSSDRLVIVPKEEIQLVKTLNTMGYACVCRGGTIKIDLNDSMQAIDIVTGIQNDINGFEVIRGNMDDVFINAITGSDDDGRRVQNERSAGIC